MCVAAAEQLKPRMKLCNNRVFCAKNTMIYNIRFARGAGCGVGGDIWWGGGGGDVQRIVILQPYLSECNPRARHCDWTVRTVLLM